MIGYRFTCTGDELSSLNGGNYLECNGDAIGTSYKCDQCKLKEKVLNKMFIINRR